MSSGVWTPPQPASEDGFDFTPSTNPGVASSPALPIAEPPAGPSSRPSAPPAAPTSDPAVAQEIALLRAISESLKGSPTSLAITGESVQPHLTEDFPFPGVKRWLIPRRPTGGLREIPINEYVEVLPANKSRVGGTIVNNGNANVLLRLCNFREANDAHAGANVGMIWLSKGGGSWDFRLGPVMWSGSISAIAEVEAGKLVAVEV